MPTLSLTALNLSLLKSRFLKRAPHCRIEVFKLGAKLLIHSKKFFNLLVLKPVTFSLGLVFAVRRSIWVKLVALSHQVLVLFEQRRNL